MKERFNVSGDKKNIQLAFDPNDPNIPIEHRRLARKLYKNTSFVDNKNTAGRDKVPPRQKKHAKTEQNKRLRMRHER